jgi:hypothetical protein
MRQILSLAWSLERAEPPGWQLCCENPPIDRNDCGAVVAVAGPVRPKLQEIQTFQFAANSLWSIGDFLD